MNAQQHPGNGQNPVQNNDQNGQAPGNQTPGNGRQWHGRQPSPYNQQGHLPPAPPYVGAPQKKNWFLRHKVLTGLGALLLVGGGAAAAGGGGDTSTDTSTDTASTQTSSSAQASNTSSSSGSSESSAAQSSSSAATSGATTKATTGATSEAAKKNTTPGLNTPVRDGKFEFTVTKVQTGVKSVGDQYLGQQAQGQYVLITVTVKNIGDKPQTMFDSNQELTDAQGRTFSPDSTAAIYMKNNDIWMKEINPGNQMSGTLVYDMPAGAKPASIELHDSMFSGGTKVSLTQ